MDSSEALVDHNRGPGEVALIAVLTAISTIIVTLRLYSKLFVLRGMSWDDGMMIAAMVFSIISSTTNILNIKTGFGRHRRFLTDSQRENSAKWFFMGGIFYNLAIFFVKFSVILFVLKIGKIKSWVRMVLYLDFVLVFGSLATAIIVQLVQCIPIAHNWNPAVSAHCLPSRTLTLVSYVSSSFTTLTDFVCAVLPFFILWDLKISKKAKISVWVLLCFGMLPGACSVVKITYLNTLVGDDTTWSSIPLMTWGAAEIHSGIVAASIPALRALVYFVATRLRGDSKRLGSSYESRNPFRRRVNAHDEDNDGNSVLPLHQRSDPGNQGGIIKTTEFEVINTSNPGAEVRPKNASDAEFVSWTLEGSSLVVSSDFDKGSVH